MNSAPMLELFASKQDQLLFPAVLAQLPATAPMPTRAPIWTPPAVDPCDTDAAGSRGDTLAVHGLRFEAGACFDSRYVQDVPVKTEPPHPCSSLPFDSLTNVTATYFGWTSGIASGNEPLNCWIVCACTRACAWIVVPGNSFMSDGMFESWSLTSRAMFVHSPRVSVSSLWLPSG